jgi:protein TonB
MAAVAVVVVLALLLALAYRLRSRGTAEAGPPLDVLGSALPEGWVPGEGTGAGKAPPPPAREPTPARGAGPAPAPEAPPYGHARPRPGLPFPEATLQPGGPSGGGPLAEATPQPAGEGGEASVFEPPRLIAMPSPEYPRMGRRMGMEATVLVRVRVSDSGRVTEAEPVGDPIGYGFEQAALRAARQARFSPGRRNGEAVFADSRIAVRFQLGE